MKISIKERAKRLQSNLPAVFIALKDRETPAAAKLLAGLTAAYVLSPVDLIPDFIPVLGYLDDLLIVPALIALTIKQIPPAVWERSKIAAQAQEQTECPRKWYYAVPVVLIWLLLIWLVVKATWPQRF